MGRRAAPIAKVWIEGTEDDEGYAEHYVVETLPWYPPYSSNCKAKKKKEDGAVGGIIADPAAHYRCVIVRGPGWQKDTLPAPMIDTNLWDPGTTRGSFGGCISHTD